MDADFAVRVTKAIAAAYEDWSAEQVLEAAVAAVRAVDSTAASMRLPTLEVLEYDRPLNDAQTPVTPKRRPNRSLSDAQARDAWIRVNRNGVSVSTVAADLGVDWGVVWQIAQGATYKDVTADLRAMPRRAG